MNTIISYISKKMPYVKILSLITNYIYDLNADL